MEMMDSMGLTPVAREVTGEGGVPIRVWDYGGDGPPLLLCHCTGACARVWDPVIAQIEAPFRIYAVDTRGHGDSGRPETQAEYAWVRCGHDVLAVIDQLKLGKGIRAVGHSGGAAHLCYAEWLRPGALSRVVLIEAIVGPREVFAGESPLADKARRRRNVFPSREEARARFAAKPPMNRWRHEALQAYVDHGLEDRPDGTVALKLPGTLEAYCYLEGGACEVFEALHTLQFDALLVAGAESYVAALVDVQADLLPKATRKHLSDTHHFVPQERPAEVAALLDQWLSIHSAHSALSEG
jgi:pimeloyl-ACP methyl ester carboxylesterase